MALQIIALTAPNPTVQLSALNCDFNPLDNTITYQFHALIKDANGKWIYDPAAGWVVNTIGSDTGKTYTMATWTPLSLAQKIQAITDDMNAYYNALAANAAAIAAGPTLS